MKIYNCFKIKLLNRKVAHAVLLFLWLTAFPLSVYASNKAMDVLNEIGVEEGPYTAADNGAAISEIIGTVISAFLALIGIIFLGLMLYAGYNWMTARGEEEKVEKAKNTINRAIIGVIIVVGAYAIWKFIFEQLISK